MKLLIVFILALLLTISACKKEFNKEVIKIEGFALKDNLGNQFGVIGNADDDWKISNWSSLSAKEQSFLNFSDNIDLTNTMVTTLYNPIGYPNPFYNQSYLEFRSTDSVKLKIAVVDASGQVFRTLAIKTKGIRPIVFDFSDIAQFPSGKSLRYYYSFSADGQLNFKAGYGDVKVCRDPVSYLNCF